MYTYIYIYIQKKKQSAFVFSKEQQIKKNHFMNSIIRGTSVPFMEAFCI